MKISLSSIVKNEADHLETCLQSVQGIDEIVICDTGSEDNTVEIAKKYTDKVFTDYVWNDNFAEARNHALSKCTGDWILIVDADERLCSPLSELYKEIELAEKNGFKTISFKAISENGVASQNSIRLFKNCPEVFWEGAIHNHLNVQENNHSNIELRYGYSTAHKKDPDRALRILIKVVKEKPTVSREKYYLAREYWYRRDYITALYWYDQYFLVSKHAAEKADGYLMAARCAWMLNQGEKAREYCLQAIKVNAHFKEALKLMASMSGENNKDAWNKFAELADNRNVLFIRN